MSQLSFDDLIPREKRKAAPISFDDLVPAAPPQGQKIPAPPAAAQTSVPVGGEATGTVLDSIRSGLSATAAPMSRMPGFIGRAGDFLGSVATPPAAPLEPMDGPQLTEYTPTLGQRVGEVLGLGGNRDRASNELAARRIAQRDGISVDQVFRDVGGNRPMFNPEGRPTLQAIPEAANVVASDLPRVLPAAAKTVMASIRGGNIGAEDSGFLDWAINKLEAPDQDIDPNYQGLAGIGDSLGYSLSTIGAFLTASAGATAATGGNPVAGIGAGLSASAAVSFRASKDEFVSRVRDMMQDQFQKLHDRPMTDAEWQSVQKEINAAANKFGAWEAVPESLSNLIFVRAFSRPLAGANAARLNKVAERATALATEQMTETATGVGQNRAELEVGLTNEELRIVDAFRQQFLQTLIVSGAMGGAAMSAQAANDFYRNTVEPNVAPGTALARAIQADLDAVAFDPDGARQAAVDSLSPDNAQMQARPVVDFADLIPSDAAAQPAAQQPLPMPDNMATEAGGSFSEPGQVVQAGPGFDTVPVLPGVGQRAGQDDLPTNQGDPDGLRQEGQETAQTQVLSEPAADRPESVAIFNGLIDVMNGGYMGQKQAMKEWQLANGLVEVRDNEPVLTARGQTLMSQLNPRGIGARSPTTQQANEIIDQFLASGPVRTVEPLAAIAPAPDTDRVADIVQRMREGTLTQPSMARANTSATAAEKASVEQMNVATLQAYEQAARQLLEGDLAGIKTNKSNSLDISLLNTLQDVQPQPIAKSAPLARGFEGTLKAIGPIMPRADIRYYLNAIHLNAERGRIEATDGHRLIVISEDLTGRIPARPQGVGGDVLVGMDGRWATSESQSNGGAKGNPKPIDGKFPDVDRVLNVADKGRTRTVSFDAAEFAAQARGIAAAAKLFDSKIVPARVSIDGAQSAFQPQYLADLADAFRRLGYDRFNLSLGEDGNGVLLAKSPDGKVTQLIMPMRDPGTPFAPIVGNDEKVFGEPKKPAAKKASPKKKAVKDFLADEGITDPAVVDAVAAEYDRLTGDDDVQNQDASDGAVAAQRGQEPADADAEQSGQQAAQPELFDTADAGRPAQDAPPQRSADQSQAGALDDRATVSTERDTGTTASNRQGVSRDDGRQENQRIKGAGTDIFSAISFTNRQSIYKDAWIDLGQDPDQMAMLPPERQFKLLADGLSKTFGLSAVQRSNRSNIRLSIDQLQDAYRNMQFMAAALDLPTKAIGLNGTLALGLTSKGKYLGAYYPQGTDGRSSDGLVMEGATVVMPGRSNSFAHEWGHALDFYIVNAFEGSVDNLSGMVRKGESLSDKMPENVRDSFRLLMNSLFFDNAEMSAKIMDLERRIEAATQKGTDPTKLKADLERLRSGASQSRQGRSEFARSSAEFGGKNPDYWTKPTEMLARSFEAYVAHKVEAIGGTTEFIAKGDDAYMSDADARLAKTFPKDSDRYNIFRSYDLLFDAIREQSLLNIAGDAVANVPANQRITNPLVYYQAQIDSSTSERIAKTWQDERNAWAKHYRDTERLQNRPKDPRTLTQRIADAPAAAIHTNRGVLLSLEARYRRNGNVQAAEAIRNITKRLATDPGSGRETIQGGTFAEAVKNETRQRLNRLGLITKSNGYENYTDAQMAQLTDVLTSVGDEAVNASPQILKLANELRNLMDGTYYYNMNSGMDIGYVADVGYLPRMLDEPLVADAPDRFLDVTGQVYDIVFERDTMRPDDDGVDIGEAIAALRTRIKEAGLDAKNDPSLQAYTEAVKELNKLNNALSQAIQRDDGDAVDAAQAALNEFIESNMDVFNDAYDYVKGEWAQKAAADYMSRVLYGSSHQSFSSHSPQGSFTKRRVLPKEADKLLAEFYIQDPVERIERYIEASVRKSEYTRLFGNGQLENQIQALQKSRVLPEDQAVILDIVTQVTGTDQSRFPERLKATAGWIHTIGSMTVLGRVVLTSLVEPMTIAIQTGRPTDGIKSMLMLMEEAVNTKNVREQRAIAELLGIVAGDASNEIIMNRLGGTVGESRRMQKISGGFFRNVLLTPYDRASRRIAMRLTGRYIIELAADVDNPSTSAQQRRFAMDELRDAGMTDMEAQAFVAWVRELDGRLPGLYDLTDPGSGELTRMGKLYGLMVNRLSVQSIQDPTAIDRPWAANTVVGRMTFSLLSFSMGFMRNNIIKSLKRVGREYEAGGYTAAQSAALGSAGAFMMLYGGHFLVTALRELALNPDRWEEEKEKDNLTQWLAQLAFSRAGFTGLADPLYNAYLGVKYQRDLANIFLGAGNSYFTQAGERILKYWAVNSENTNSAERSAARGWYELLALPAMAMVTGSVPGRMMGYGAGLSYAYLSSPRAKEKVQDVVAGEKQGTKSKTGQGGQSSGAF
jgi:hypothetical protein